VTSTPLPNAWHNAEALNGPLDESVSDSKPRPGRNIGVQGSIELAQSLLGPEHPQWPSREPGGWK
jgi:hypothetical protein